MRVWEVTPQGQYMKVALKEHKGAVSCIKIRTNDEEVCVGGLTLTGVRVHLIVTGVLLSCSASQPALMVPASSGTSRELLQSTPAGQVSLSLSQYHWLSPCSGDLCGAR